MLSGAAAINGTGNPLNNSLTGNGAANIINGGAGADILSGNGGNDTFVFNFGEANGDTIVDFDGLGASGDSLWFVGYGSGATLTNIDATHWQIDYNGGASHEVITFSNAASLHPATTCSCDSSLELASSQTVAAGKRVTQQSTLLEFQNRTFSCRLARARRRTLVC
ncbi:hypothetical protein LJR220_002127 [Bradyrhizobium sp. LjRoot220]|uniref:hypothetical protein n=1 Tax=Bradyrhizobium sp. LjRoot220 TaxID=3342284 RepID=UPI003ECDE8F6